MAAPLRDRAAAMLRRVEADALTVLDAADTAQLVETLDHALRVRDAHIPDDHDPRYLHPARTVRILVADAACADVVTLMAAACVDTLDTELAVAPRDARAAHVAAACPPPVPEETLLERLVSAPPAALLVTVAERLDHARHLHLRPELQWDELHRQVLDCYLPAAARADAVLARRLDRWADAFTRHLVRRRRSG